MGALWSTPRKEYTEVSSGDTNKRQKVSSLSLGNSRLIPNLPDEISIQIFARIPRVHYFSMRLVSQNWKKLLSSNELFHLRKELGLTEEWLYLLAKLESTKLVWFAIDPLSRSWQRLPPLPYVDYEEENKRVFSGLRLFNMVGGSYIFPEFVRGLFGQKHVPDQLPFSGCSVGIVNGCLYVLGGFCQSSAMSCVWRYDPIMNTWNEVAPMTVGRAYCKTGVLNNKLFVIGGVTGGQGGLLPLQSGEVFDPCTNTWSELPTMPFSKAQSVPAPFMVEMLRPIATGMSTYKGKLCVPQSLYSWPFLVDVGGEIYDPDTNTWQEMPVGMGEGWPTKQAGTKLSIVVDGELYALDPNSSLNSGKMKVYDEAEDAWKVVIEKVPISNFSDSESPYLLANIDGMIHVITQDTNCNIVISRAEVCGDVGSLPSCPVRSLDSKSDTVVWKVIGSSDFGPAELVSCQVLDI